MILSHPSNSFSEGFSSKDRPTASSKHTVAQPQPVQKTVSQEQPATSDPTIAHKSAEDQASSAISPPQPQSQSPAKTQSSASTQSPVSTQGAQPVQKDAEKKKKTGKKQEKYQENELASGRKDETPSPSGSNVRQFWA